MKCNAKVQMGSYTYAARNSERQCGNHAQSNGFCHLHQPVTVTETQSAAFAAMRAQILADVNRAS